MVFIYFSLFSIERLRPGGRSYPGPALMDPVHCLLTPEAEVNVIYIILATRRKCP